MDTSHIKKATKHTLTNEIATRQSDPNFYGALSFLPNPDTVLRNLGKSWEAFDAIYGDAHVMGELRSIRSGMLSFEYRLNAASDDAQDVRAKELCDQVLKHKPAPGMTWSDVIWNMAKSIFFGFAVHEVIWQRQGNFLIPGLVLDKPQRRFVFGTENELRLRTRENLMNGEELGDKKWLLTRHMPSYDNPYGIAVFSACFWPYIFKHNGFKYFAKFCEKYGIPWAIGKLPMGTDKTVQDEMLANLVSMIEDAVATIPSDGSVELLEHLHSGQLVHERLIQVCNSEMSKALTSQTLATEVQDKGARAVSETHREREQSVNESDRETICDTFNQLFAWITELNISGAQPPKFEFYEEAEARKEWVEVLTGANSLVDIPKQFAHDRLQIPMPKDGEEVLPKTNSKPPTAQPEFSTCPHCGEAHDFNAQDDEFEQLISNASDQADTIITDMAGPIKQLLISYEKDGKSMKDFQDALVQMYPGIDENRLADHTRDVLLLGLLQGMDDA